MKDNNINIKINKFFPGRYSEDVNQPGLRDSIVNIVEDTSATDPRRRTEKSITNILLPLLTSKLHDEGYKISKSAVTL